MNPWLMMTAGSFSPAGRYSLPRMVSPSRVQEKSCVSISML